MKHEDLAHWYFRLNGCFTILNFVLHPARRGGQLTDADILGVRFPHRAEFSDLPDFDDVEFRELDLPLILCVEVTRDQCKLNGPWRDRNRESIHALLRALGPCPPELIDAVASALYDTGRARHGNLLYSLFCVGNSVSDALRQRYPEVPQKTWRDVIRFIHERFRTYRSRKTDHEQWDKVGQQLWTMSEKHRDIAQFEAAVRRLFELPA
jgi:hypothetical protein